MTPGPPAWPLDHVSLDLGTGRPTTTNHILSPRHGQMCIPLPKVQGGQGTCPSHTASNLRDTVTRLSRLPPGTLVALGSTLRLGGPHTGAASHLTALSPSSFILLQQKTPRRAQPAHHYPPSRALTARLGPLAPRGQTLGEGVPCTPTVQELQQPEPPSSPRAPCWDQAPGAALPLPSPAGHRTAQRAKGPGSWCWGVALWGWGLRVPGVAVIWVPS